MTSPGLTVLALPDLQALLAALKRGALAAPVTTAALAAMGLSASASAVESVFRGLSTEGVARMVDVAIAERLHRPPPRLELVWSGPEAHTSRARDTAIVVQRLFAGAQRSVLVGGFAFDNGADIFRPLHEAMVARSVSATFFVDIQGHAPTKEGARPYAREQLRRFLTENWPFGPPFPDLYYDPRTAVAGPPWASLHAKCVVVDESRTFITSANFTDRGQRRNIEAGVLIEDPDFAVKLTGQWRGLMIAGQVDRFDVTLSAPQPG